MIYEGSRYEDDAVVQVTDHHGRMQPAIYVRQDIDRQFFTFDWYTAREGDRYDNLAHRLYNDPEQWYLIARANPEVFYPDLIPMGTVLRLPYA